MKKNETKIVTCCASKMEKIHASCVAPHSKSFSASWCAVSIGASNLENWSCFRELFYMFTKSTYRGTVISADSPPLHAFAIKKHVNSANIPIIISGKCFALLNMFILCINEFLALIWYTTLLDLRKIDWLL